MPAERDELLTSLVDLDGSQYFAINRTGTLLWPLLVKRYEWIADTAGPGKYRGGLGLRKVYSLPQGSRLTVAFERAKCPPWGLFGGGACMCSPGIQVTTDAPVSLVANIVGQSCTEPNGDLTDSFLSSDRRAILLESGLSHCCSISRVEEKTVEAR